MAVAMEEKSTGKLAVLLMPVDMPMKDFPSYARFYPDDSRGHAVERIPANNSMINAEEFMVYDGPYHSLRKSGSIEVSDRVTNSSRFKGIVIPLENAVFYDKYCVGHEKTKFGHTLRLFVDDTPTAADTMQNDTISVSLSVVLVSDDIYFFSFERTSSGAHSIYQAFNSFYHLTTSFDQA